ncbi:transcriptional regulator FeaR [Pseudomonas cremoricolorata]|uniref:Transcriptional regulator n=1 Tax=Pseudomonas cremoricolorata TaxID=157783 RepID=A0A089WQ52_9PSED|nr:transcriptional regulator FeaR [Pseudomonas cremoricolorata]AIR90696.1 transcriptional regulator [Pseudomonas cremoricolorata]
MNAAPLNIWNERVHSVCGRFETRYDHCQSLFIGELHKVMLGSTEVAYIRSNASVIAKSRHAAGAEPDPYCFLVLQQHGEMDIELGDRVVQLREGDLALLDCATSLKMMPKGLFGHVSIHLPKARLAGIGPEQFGKLSSTGACGQLLSTLVRQVAGGELGQWACNEDGAGLQDALLALLGSVLQYRASDPAASLHLHEVQALIQQRLDSLRLSPASLADELGISSRQLYRLFEARGDSVCRYILRERLRRAAQDLRNPACMHRSITDIGAAWGFADSAHFSKTFKKQMGVTPRDYRAGSH